MRKTSNIELSLYDPTDTFDITGSSNSLNHNMEIIDQKFSDTPNSSDIEKVNKDIASLKEGTNSLKEDLEKCKNKHFVTLVDVECNFSNFSYSWIDGSGSTGSSSTSILYNAMCHLKSDNTYIITQDVSKFADSLGARRSSVLKDSGGNVVDTFELVIDKYKMFAITPKKDSELYFCTNKFSENIRVRKVEFSKSFDGVFTPDEFEGSDSEKLQTALYCLSNTGGIITINRPYIIESDIRILHKKSSYPIKLIGVNIPTIDMGEFKFMGWGGENVEFHNMKFKGTELFCNVVDLKFVSVYNCEFSGFKYIGYVEPDSTSILQQYKFKHCYFHHISECVLSVATFYVLSIDSCIFEYNKQVLNLTPTIHGNKLSIINNVIEFNSAEKPEIYIEGGNSVIIDNNYFETEAGYSTLCIDISKFGTTEIPDKVVCGGLSICNNMVDLGQKNDFFTSYFLKLPSRNFKSGTWADMTLGIIQNNTIASPGHMINFEHSTDELLPIVVGNNKCIRHSYPYSNPLLRPVTETWRPPLYESENT